MDKVYIYLENPGYTQTILESRLNNEQVLEFPCEELTTNGELNKSVSLTGGSLDPNSNAFPCGELVIDYPEGSFTISNLETGEILNIKTDDITETKFQFHNQDLEKQWADVTSDSFETWT